jgi:phospho-N-acetylmuramoyl-pentapeptide-transferase
MNIINYLFGSPHIIYFSISIFIFLFLIGLIIRFKKYFIVNKVRDFLDMGEHHQKQGTPTMGGLVFYVVLPMLYFFYAGNLKFWFIAITAGLSGLIGAIDDWYKINFGVGLTVKIKFILQMVSALFSGLFFYYAFPLDLYINFFGWHLDLGVGYIFWIMWVIMATTHAVNLIDGIDGLAISQILIIQLFSPISLFINDTFWNLFSLFWYYFFVFNRYKAKIFMGDVGAFFLGGYLASSFIAARCELLLVIVGMIFVINTLMIIIQTAYYKRYKLRFFSFTPYHHALEKRGWSENKICLVYSFLTIIGSIGGVFLYMRYFN